MASSMRASAKKQLVVRSPATATNGAQKAKVSPTRERLGSNGDDSVFDFDKLNLSDAQHEGPFWSTPKRKRLWFQSLQ